MKIKTGIIGWLCVIVSAIILMGSILSFIIIEQFHDATLQRAVQTNANFIMTQAETNLTPADFAADKLAENEKTFSKFFAGVDTAEIIRIKVWNLDGIVVYSDDKNILGKNFSDNPQFVQALHGQTVAKIEEPEKEENTDEKNVGELMEIYVPVKSGSGKIMGIIETYTSLELVNDSIRSLNTLVFAVMLSGSVFVGIVVTLVFVNLRKKVVAPVLEIQGASKRIASGDFDIQLTTNGYDEIKNLADDVDFMARALLKQRDALVKAERLSAIGELAARLAHDLRNPLNVIKTTLKVLSSESEIPINKNWQESFSRMDRSITRMTHQIDDVMDFVRTKPLRLESHLLSNLLLKSLERINVPNSVTIILPKNDYKIVCDSEQMEIVFSNLLLNSIQAMDNKGTIEVRATEQNQKLIIEVEDSGPGIQEDKIKNLFEPLFTTKQIGTGLGLTSCKNIVTKHQGMISFKNHPTTFTITLPQDLKIPENAKHDALSELQVGHVN